MEKKHIDLKEKNISEAIKEIREKNNLSQREFASLTGVSNALISRLESGIVQQPGMKFILDVSEIFNVSEIDLARCAGYHFDRGNIVEKIQKYTDLSEEKIKTFIKVDNSSKEEYLDLKSLLADYKNDKINIKETIICIIVMDGIDVAINEEIISNL